MLLYSAYGLLLYSDYVVMIAVYSVYTMVT